jgi:L-threonylcarbamoyladenylate synthase
MENVSGALRFAGNPSGLAEACRLLEEGGLLAVATETVWGIACDAALEASVARIYQVKGRSFTKPLQCLCPDLESAAALADFRDAGLQENFLSLARFWPGPLTLVVPARSSVSPWMAPGGQIGLRVPGLSAVAELLAAYRRPLAATSLNLSGAPAALTLEEVLAVPGLYDGYLPGQAGIGLASTVFDLRRAALLREGPISREELLACMRP